MGIPTKANTRRAAFVRRRYNCPAGKTSSAARKTNNSSIELYLALVRLEAMMREVMRSHGSSSFASVPRENANLIKSKCSARRSRDTSSLSVHRFPRGIAQEAWQRVVPSSDRVPYVCHADRSLQEIETDQFHLYFLPELQKIGYDGVFSPKSRAKTMSEQERRFVDGCAIFYRQSK